MKTAENYISKGQLVPDELIIDILANVLDSKKDSKGVIFDGFPRTIPQGKALDEMLKERNTKVQSVISLEVDEKELINRLLKRGEISGRSDDNLETIQSRLQVYHEQTSPLKEYYIAQNKLSPVEGIGTIEEIFSRIESSLDNF